MQLSTLFKIQLFTFLVFLLFASACIPPRCKIPNCHVVIDHDHMKYGKTVKGGKSGYKVYRGLPWYRYAFRKKHKSKVSDGRYRKIDTRETQ